MHDHVGIKPIFDSVDSKEKEKRKRGKGNLKQSGALVNDERLKYITLAGLFCRTKLNKKDNLTGQNFW